MSAKLNTTKITINNGIVYAECLPNTIMTLKEAKQITQLTLDMLGKDVLPLFCDISNVIKMPIECRNHFSGNEHAKTFTKCALITNSKVSQVIGNFFLGLNKPIKPTKLFTNNELALIWLNKK